MCQLIENNHIHIYCILVCYLLSGVDCNGRVEMLSLCMYHWGAEYRHYCWHMWCRHYYWYIICIHPHIWCMCLCYCCSNWLPMRISRSYSHCCMSNTGLRICYTYRHSCSTRHYISSILLYLNTAYNSRHILYMLHHCCPTNTIPRTILNYLLYIRGSLQMGNAGTMHVSLCSTHSYTMCTTSPIFYFTLPASIFYTFYNL